MKIENKWFRFTFDKKKRGGTWLPLLLCAALLASSFGSGMWLGSRNSRKDTLPTEPLPQEGGVAAGDVSKTGDGEGSDPDASFMEDLDAEDIYVEGTYVASTLLAGSLKEKYGEAVSPYGYTYGEPITGIKRDEGIVLQAGYDMLQADFDYWTEIAQLYSDPQLTHSVGYNWEYDEDSHVLTLNPSNNPVGLIGLSSLDTATAARYAHDDLKLFPHDAGTDWGNLGTMYLAVYVDIETGEQLDMPEVRVVTVDGELPDTPQLTYSFMDDGRVRFNWTPVEGAQEYFVCQMTCDQNGGPNSFNWMIAQTTETEWISESPQYGATSANGEFRNYKVAEDDWYSDYNRAKRIEEYGEEPLYVYREEYRKAYCVIAVSEAGSSMMSNQVDILDIQSNIPVSLAKGIWKANGDMNQGLETVEELPPYGYVTMADGSTAMKLIDYDTENAMIIEDRYIFLDDDGNYLEGKNLKDLKIPYQIEGTPFEDTVRLTDYDESRLEEDLRFIEEREDLLRKRAGEVALNNGIEFEEDEVAVDEVRQLEEIQITANSALSEYLAVNMLSGAKVIDVSEFQEAADPGLLTDALLEAYYQNPLIFGISGYRTNRRGTAVKVVYENSAEEQARKQEEVRAKVAEIVGEIITPGMTELEKELAINEYLCSHCTYDDDALENAEKNNFQYVDEMFNDSFNAYGALINGRCVCAGYAAAFKLLADAAGLECVVVTGTLEGTLPHAWNKVRIDGDWEILDVTNNDNEFLSNALLNLPDEVGRRTLTEDSDYVMDGYLRNYASTNGQKEYYRINRMYYPYDEIAVQLAEQLNKNGMALLRTEYALDDEIFERIGSEVYDALEGDDPIYGYHWLGVIYLTY